MAGLDKLMFQVGVNKVVKNLSEVESALNEFVNTYGNKLSLQVKIDKTKGLVDVLGAIGDTRQLQSYRDEIERLKGRLKDLENAAKNASKETGNVGKAGGKSQGGGGSDAYLNQNIDRLHKVQREVENAWGKISSQYDDAKQKGYTSNWIESRIAQLERYHQELRRVEQEEQATLRKSGGLNSLKFEGEMLTGSVNRLMYSGSAVKEVEAEIRKMMSTYASFSAEVAKSENLPKGSLAKHLGEDARNAANTLSEQKGRIEHLMRSLVHSYQALSANQSLARQDGLRVVNATAEIEAAKRAFQELQSMRKGGIVNEADVQRAERIAEALARVNQEQKNVYRQGGSQSKSTQDTQQNTQAKQQNARATRQMTDEERQLAQALRQSSGHMQGQSQILGDLKSMAMQYLGVWGGQQFLHNIIEIGGQLEMQRLSISAILGDAAQGRALFEDIKRLAVKSPFGVVELDQYTKQLSAYGFQSNELYDMTKRLADIAAGAGTDVGRLALALGHVRSEGALTGYTLRQFAMNNIPMLQKLSERLTEVEGKIVSTAEIRKRVSKKEIGYEDVIAVINDLTNEGGMFYNMQETISESVKAKFKNLKDSMDIMYGEMAESGPIGGVLKAIAQGLTSMTREWKVAMPVIMATVGAISMQKVSMLANNKALVAGNVAAGRFSAAQMEMQAHTGLLTKKMLLNAVAAKKVSVADAEAAGAVFGLSRAQLQYVANTGKATAATSLATLGTSKYTVAQLRAIVALKKVDGTFGIWSRIKIGIMAATNAVNGFGFALKGLWAVTKSFAWIAALDLIIGGIAKQVEKVTAQKDRIKEMGTAAQEGFKNMKEFSVGLKVDGKLNDSDYKTQIDSMVQQLKEYSPQVGNVLKEVFKTGSDGANAHSLAEQFRILKQEVDATTGAYRDLEKIKGIYEAANEKTDGWFDESFRENVKDYADALAKQDRAENDFLTNRIEISDALEKARGDYEVFNKAVEDNVKLFKESKGKQGFSEDDIKAQVNLLQSYATQFQELRDKGLQVPESLKQGQQAYSMFNDAMNEATTSWQKYSETIGKTSTAHKRMMDDAAVFAKQLVKMAEGEFGHTFDKFTESEKRAVQIGLQDFLNAIDGFKDMSAEARHALENDILKPFSIKIDADIEEAYQQVSALQSHLEKITSKEWTVNIKAVTSSEDLVQKTREAHKSDTDSMKRNWTIISGTKRYSKSQLESQATDIDKLVEGESDIVVKDALKRYHERWLSEQTNKSLSDKYGFSLIDDIKGGKTEKPGKSGSKNDTQLKAWREQLKELENFYNVYKRYAEYMSKDDAIQKALDSDVFKGKNLPKNIDDYLSVLQDFRRKVEAEMGKNPGTERKSFLTDLLTKIDQKEFDAKTKEAAEKLLKQLDRELTAQGKKWDLYKRVLDATGDKGQAATMAFGGMVGFGDFAEQLRKQVEDKLKELKSPFTVEELLGMDEDELTLHFKEKGADGVYKMVQKLREETQQLRSQQVEMYLDAVKSAKGYEAELRKIEAQYRKSADAILAMNPADTDALKAAMETRNESRAKVELEELKKSLNWEETFRDLDKQSTTYLQRLKEKLRAALKDKDLKPEQAKTLIEQIDKVDGQLGKRNFLTALLPGLRERRRITEETVEAEERLAKAIANEAAANLKVVGDKMRIQELLGQGGVNADISQITPESREELMKDIQPGGELYKALLELFKKLAEDSAEASTANGQTGAARRDVSRQWEKLKSVKGIDSFFTEGFGGSDPISIIKGVNQNVQSLSELVDTIGLGDTEFGESVHEFADGCQSFSGVVDSLASGDVFGAVNGIVKGFQSWGRAFHLDDAFNNSNAEEVMRTTERLTKSNEVLAKRIDSLSERIGSSAGVDSINAYKQAVKAQREVNGNTLKVLKAQMSYHHAHQSNAHYASNETIASYNRTAQNAFRTAGLEGFEITGLQSVYDAIAKDPRYLKAIRDFAPQLWEYLTEVGKYDKSEYWDAVVEDAEALEELTKQITENMTGWTADTLVDSWAQLVAGMNSGVNDLTQNLEEKLREAIVNSMIDNLFKDRLQSLLSQAWDNSQYIDQNGNVRTHHYDSDGNITDTDVASEYTPSEIADIRKEAKSAAEDILGVFGVLKDALGFTESGSTSSKVISGGFTEQETGLLLSYVNGIRADLSLQRADVNKIAQEYMPNLVNAMTAGNNSLRLIESNTNSMTVMMEAYSRDISEIRSILSRARDSKGFGFYMK